MVKKNELKFDAKKHEYTVDGKRILSVTTVLPDIPEYLLYKQFFIDASHRGTRVHECVDVINKHYMKTGAIPEPKVYKGKNFLIEDEPYVKAYLKFLKVRRPNILLSEEKMFHMEYGYAGTVDIVGSVSGKFGILDVKTTTMIAPYARLQLAAYVHLYNKLYPKKKALYRHIVHLKPNTTYELVPFRNDELDEDFNVFLAKLKSAQWDMENMSKKY
jgi:hypothetical protein